jgi:hypothetical protein
MKIRSKQPFRSVYKDDFTINKQIIILSNKKIIHINSKKTNNLFGNYQIIFVSLQQLSLMLCFMKRWESPLH